MTTIEFFDNFGFEGQPRISTRTYTVRDIYEALKKNGLDHLRGQWYSENDKGKTVGACVLGQAAFNMQVPANGNHNVTGNLEEFLISLPIDPNSRWAKSSTGKWTYRNTAEAIIGWNDEVLVDEKGKAQKTIQGHVKYALRYYYQVVQMAYDLLEPYFDKTITLPHYEY